MGVLEVRIGVGYDLRWGWMMWGVVGFVLVMVAVVNLKVVFAVALVRIVP